MKRKLRSFRKAASIAAFFFSAAFGTAGAAGEGDAFSIPREGVAFLTGDSWIQGGYTIRLYGVQACLRGKTYTDHAGQAQDCGAVSMAMLAALIRDTNPVCRPIASLTADGSAQPPTVLAICTVQLGGRALDLGSMMITQGFAFAALANGGKPVYIPYQIEESIAQAARAGLWAFDDLPHPSRDLLGIVQPQSRK